MTSLTNESPQAAGAGIIGVFVTVGGALVVVRREDSRALPYVWQCLGCEQCSFGQSQYEIGSDEWAAKQSAIEHASACRAVPRAADAEAPVPAGDRLVAEAVRELASVLGELGARVTEAERVVSEDLDAVRKEVADEVAALRAELAKYREQRAQVVAALRDIATALTDLVQRGDRPRWWRRRRRLAEDGEGVSA